MSTCIVCGKEVHIDDGYATDGKIFICRHCAEIETLRTITVYISNAGVESSLVYKREAPIEMAVESGLVNQTGEKPHIELDKSILDTNSETGYFYADDSPVTTADLEEHELLSSGLVNQTSDSIHKAETITLEEYDREIERDIKTMSEEDFLSKYCDGYAVGKWYDAHVADHPTY